LTAGQTILRYLTRSAELAAGVRAQIQEFEIFDCFEFDYCSINSNVVSKQTAAATNLGSQTGYQNIENVYFCFCFS
jgi:hypothetical protein